MYWWYMVYTIGYSGFTPSEFMQELKKRGVEVVVDVRRFPRSKYPFYAGDALRSALAETGINYVWLGELGALGVRGPRAGCVESHTFDVYVWRLYHYAPALFQLEELVSLAKRHTVAILCREENWRACHRQFLADYLTRQGLEVVHIRRVGEERHVPTPCYRTYNPPPLDLVKRVYRDFQKLCTNSSVYLFGGALEGGEDVDVIVYGFGGDLPPGYDAQILPTPADDLFHYFVTHTGVLICGRAYVIDLEKALKEEVAVAKARAHVFLKSSDPVAVCKSAKGLVFTAAALLCGAAQVYTWARAARCLAERGLEPPPYFKRCLSPPPLQELKKWARYVETLADVIAHASGHR